MGGNDRTTRTARRLVALACSAAVFVSLCMVPSSALAVVNMGAVFLSLPGYASCTAGDSESVSCAVTPASSSQIPNCSMDYCPSGCEATGQGGCLDASGQCTCNGGGYHTYYPTVNVYSDNPGVARASWSNGTLCISTYSPGTATLTVEASLRLHTDAVSSMTVDVAAPASAGSDNQSASASAAGVQSVAPVATGDSSGSVSGVVAVASGISVGVPVGEDALSDSRILVGHLTDANVSAKDMIGQIAGTDDRVMLWAGVDQGAPDYAWYVSGHDIAAAPSGNVDMTAVDVTASNGQLADRLSGKTYIAIDATSCGTLPGPMTLLWRTARTFPNDTYVNLYSYDQTTGNLASIQKNLQVKEGYASFGVTQGRVFVLSDDPNLESSATSTASLQIDSGAADGDESALPVSQPVLTQPVFVFGGLAVLIAVAAALVFFRRKQSASNGTAKKESRQSAARKQTDDSRKEIDSLEDNKTIPDEKAENRLAEASSAHADMGDGKGNKR
jgi:hypothetical protein